MRTPRLSRRQPKIHIIFARILSRLGEIDGMAMNTQSLSDSARLRVYSDLRGLAGSRESSLRPGCSFCRTFPFFAGLRGLSSVASQGSEELIIRWSKVRILAGPLKSLETIVSSPRSVSRRKAASEKGLRL